MQLPDWGTAIGAVVNKVTQWIPSPKQSKEDQIERLINENAKLAQEEPLSARTANRIGTNLSTIKLLRSQVSHIE